MGKEALKKTVIFIECIGFGTVMFFLWANEIFDLPHLLFGSLATPINWVECIFESAMLLFLGIYAITASFFLLDEMKPPKTGPAVCPTCKKMKVDDRWIAFEEYVSTVCAEEQQLDRCGGCHESEQVVKQKGA